ncbi:hypothetical protein BGZ82_008688 [Podila clonocystis]|nr:hypothetical protein BGZ82_008688 [Podila clonocystis]
MKFPIALTILAALAVVHSAPVPTTDSTGIQALGNPAGSVAIQSHSSDQSLKKRLSEGEETTTQSTTESATPEGVTPTGTEAEGGAPTGTEAEGGAPTGTEAEDGAPTGTEAEGGDLTGGDPEGATESDNE